MSAIRPVQRTAIFTVWMELRALGRLVGAAGLDGAGAQQHLRAPRYVSTDACVALRLTSSTAPFVVSSISILTPRAVAAVSPQA